MLGSLKRLLGRLQGKPSKRSVYFHEDDFCQIELLPESARHYCVTEMGIIDDFAARHSQVGMGYSDMYVRPDAPHSFAELQISLSEFSNALKPHFPAYDSVFTGYSSHREPCKNVSAWGNGVFTIFAGYKTDIIQHVWLGFGACDAAGSSRIILDLRALPKSDSILIADWSWSVIAAPTDADSLIAYLQRRTEND